MFESIRFINSTYLYLQKSSDYQFTGKKSYHSVTVFYKLKINSIFNWKYYGSYVLLMNFKNHNLNKFIINQYIEISVLNESPCKHMHIYVFKGTLPLLD